MSLFPRNLSEYLAQIGVPRGDNAKVFLVDSVHGSASNTGTKGNAPLATLAGAIALCTASHGDIIVLAPGHAETIAAAASNPTLSKAGVSVVGLGQGALRPTFTFTHVDANIVVSAASCSIRNVLFVNDVASQVEVVDVDADDFTLENCEFREGSAKQFLTAIDINGGGANAADRCVVRNCKIVSEAAGAVNAIEIGAVQNGTVIEGNWISGDFSDAAISSGSVCTNMLIKNNVIRNVNAGDWAIELTAAATGLCVGNRFMADGAATTLDPGSLMCVDNLMVNAIDTSSIPVPTTAAGVLPTGAIGAASFAAGAITATVIATDAIGHDEIADGAIDAAKFAAGAITAAVIATNAIDADALAADAVDEIWDEAVTGHTTQGTAGQAMISCEMCCEKSNGAVLGVADPIFTIGGGPIEILEIAGIVTTQIGAGASNCSLQLVTTTPSATVDLNAAPVDIDGDVAGTCYQTINTTGIFTPVTAGWVLRANSFATNPTTYFAPPGTIQCLTTAARDGNIKWYIRYKPLSPLSNVTAAA